MTGSPIVGVSHAIIWVRDLDIAATKYERLGFSLSQRYIHPKSVGTANYNMMFESDYLELLVSVEDNARNAVRLARLAAEGEGLKDVALLTDDAQAAFETVNAAGLEPLPPFEHHRPEGADVARFRLIYMPPDRLLPGLGFHIMHRLTPALMWRGANVSHANGACGIAGIVVATADPPRLAEPYAGMLGVEPQSTDAGISVRAGKSRLLFASPDKLRGMFPQQRVPSQAPTVVALELFAANLGDTARWFAENDIPHRNSSDGAIEIFSEDACGVVLRFVPREQ